MFSTIIASGWFDADSPKSQSNSMYIPTANRIDDPELIVELMRQNPFATVVSVVEGVPVATHLPILVEPGEPMLLLGHIARANPQWKCWAANSSILVIFAGAHGYVSPRWYESRPNVPTWNYVSVHVAGKVEIIEGDEQALAHLERMVGTFDPNLAELQPDSMDRAFLRKLLPGIVVFRIAVDRVDAKAKLSQNKSEADQRGVREQFLASGDSDGQKMALLMGRSLDKTPPG